jgi:hypothetical protein
LTDRRHAPDQERGDGPAASGCSSTPADPVSYAKRIRKDPPPGNAARASGAATGIDPARGGSIPEVAIPEVPIVLPLPESLSFLP